MPRIIACVVALSLVASAALAQSGSLTPGKAAGTAKAQSISTFWVMTSGALLLGAGAYFISTQESTSATGLSFSSSDGETLLTPPSVVTSTTTT